MAVDPLLEHKRRHPINPHEFIGLAAKFGIHVDYVYLLMNDKLKKELDPYYIYFFVFACKSVINFLLAVYFANIIQVCEFQYFDWLHQVSIVWIFEILFRMALPM